MLDESADDPTNGGEDGSGSMVAGAVTTAGWTHGAGGGGASSNGGSSSTPPASANGGTGGGGGPVEGPSVGGAWLGATPVRGTLPVASGGSDAGGVPLDGGAAEGGASTVLDGGVHADAGSAVEREPPSCRSERPLCGDDGARASCCEALPVRDSAFAMTVDNSRIIPASVSSFRLDRFEVTVGRMRAFIADYDHWRGLEQPAPGSGAHPLIAGSGWQEGYDRHLPATAAALDAELRHCSDIPFSTHADGLTDAVPLNCVSWYEAAAFCAWDGGRLPTFAELVAAGAGGEDNRLYPWGNAPVPRRELALFGCRIDVAAPVCTVDDVTPVGLRPLGAGRFGHDDLAGSMSEWVLDRSPMFAESCSDCMSIGDELLRTWRGGSWLDGADDMKNVRFASMEPVHRIHFLGLRCARDE